MPDLNHAELAELRRLHEAATPEPWKAYTPDWEETTESRMSISMKSYMDDSACYRTVDLIEAYADFYPEDAEYDEAVANVQLIAAARNALPRLLDRIEAAEAEVARLREALKRIATNESSDLAYSANKRWEVIGIARVALEGR